MAGVCACVHKCYVAVSINWGFLGWVPILYGVYTRAMIFMYLCTWLKVFSRNLIAAHLQDIGTCMRKCIHAYIHTCIHTYIYTHIYIYACVCMYTHRRAHTHTHTLMYTCTYMRVYVYIHIQTCSSKFSSHLFLEHRCHFACS